MISRQKVWSNIIAVVVIVVTISPLILIIIDIIMRKNFNLFKVFAKSSQGALLYGTQSGANFVLIFFGISFVFLHLDTLYILMLIMTMMLQ